MATLDSRPKELALFVLFLIITSPLLSQGDWTKVVSDIQPSTVVIYTYNANNEPLGLGSGFFISKQGHILTNHHVLFGADKAEILMPSGEVYPITHVYGEDDILDLIKVKADVPAGIAIPLNVIRELPRVGERILVIGSPRGLEGSVSDGIISAVRHIAGMGNIIQISAPISPGSSGSPVVNSTGQVIGLAAFSYGQGQNLNFAIPGAAILGLENIEKTTFSSWVIDNHSKVEAAIYDVFRLGFSHVLNEEYRNALPYFLEIIEQDPYHVSAHYWAAFCFYNIGLYRQAIEAYSGAIKLNPRDADAYFFRGSTKRDLNDFNGAIADYSKAIELEPWNADAYTSRGDVKSILKDPYGAIADYTRAIDLDSRNPDTYILRGFERSDLRDYEGAITDFTKAIELDPRNAQAYYFRGFEKLKIEHVYSGCLDFKRAIDLGFERANEAYRRYCR